MADHLKVQEAAAAATEVEVWLHACDPSDVTHMCCEVLSAHVRCPHGGLGGVHATEQGWCCRPVPPAC